MREDGGKVIDVNFIPDYKKLLHLEIKKNQIMDIKDLISRKEGSFVRRWFFPNIFRNDFTIQKELDRIESKMQKATEHPVFSSGHAFVCFDSLLSAYKCLSEFEDNAWSKVSIQVKNIVENIKNERRTTKLNTSTFQKFHEDDLELEMMDPEKIDLLVDQLIEPSDIIWTNVGGSRGLFIFRRILCNVVIVLILIFLTTPTVNN